MTNIIFVFVVGIVGALLIRGVSSLDTQRAAAAHTYEQCVQKEYGISPSRFMQEQGHYPECQ